MTDVYQPNENVELTPLQPACQPLTVSTDNPSIENNDLKTLSNSQLENREILDHLHHQSNSNHFSQAQNNHSTDNNLLKIQAHNGVNYHDHHNHHHSSSFHTQNNPFSKLPGMTPIHNNQHDFQNAPVNDSGMITPGQGDGNVVNHFLQNDAHNHYEHEIEGNNTDIDSTDYKSDLPSNIDTPVKNQAISQNHQNVNQHHQIDVVGSYSGEQQPRNELLRNSNNFENTQNNNNFCPEIHNKNPNLHNQQKHFVK